MKTITSITYPVLALFAFACFAAAAGVLGAESIGEDLNLPVQSDTVNVSPELAGVETGTVLGLYNSSTHETRIWYMDNNVHVGTVAGPRLHRVHDHPGQHRVYRAAEALEGVGEPCT